MSESRLERTPLFPLQTVLFPGGLLQLKIFEARYLDLVSRCLREQSSFGVVCLQQGAEAGAGSKTIRTEMVGVQARIDDVDAKEAGILYIRCSGGHRFRLLDAPRQETNGLWAALSEPIAADEVEAPAPSMKRAVEALAQAAARLEAEGHNPFAHPLRLDDAGWVANRWCEILPISLAAKQKLMELESPRLRLQLVDEFLRSKQVLRD